MSDWLMGEAVCDMEGCSYDQPWGVKCRRCGKVNRSALGYAGFFGRIAKKWGLTRDEAYARYLATVDAENYREQSRSGL